MSVHDTATSISFPFPSAAVNMTRRNDEHRFRKKNS